MMAAIPYTFPSPSPVYTRARVITRDTKWRIMIFRCDNPGNIAISSVKSLFHTRQPTPARLLSMFTRRYTMNNRRPEISRAWKFSFSRERRGGRGRMADFNAVYRSRGVVLFRRTCGRTRLTRFRHEGDGCNEIELIEFGGRAPRVRGGKWSSFDVCLVMISTYYVTWRTVDWITLSRETFARKLFPASCHPIILRVVCFHRRECACVYNNTRDLKNVLNCVEYTGSVRLFIFEVWEFLWMNLIYFQD